MDIKYLTHSQKPNKLLIAYLDYFLAFPPINGEFLSNFNTYYPKGLGNVVFQLIYYELLSWYIYTHIQTKVKYEIKNI